MYTETVNKDIDENPRGEWLKYLNPKTYAEINRLHTDDAKIEFVTKTLMDLKWLFEDFKNNRSFLQRILGMCKSSKEMDKKVMELGYALDYCVDLIVDSRIRAQVRLHVADRVANIK